jgi:hypothetical protein
MERSTPANPAQEDQSLEQRYVFGTASTMPWAPLDPDTAAYEFIHRRLSILEVAQDASAIGRFIHDKLMWSWDTGLRNSGNWRAVMRCILASMDLEIRDLLPSPLDIDCMSSFQRECHDRANDIHRAALKHFPELDNKKEAGSSSGGKETIHSQRSDPSTAQSSNSPHDDNNNNDNYGITNTHPPSTHCACGRRLPSSTTRSLHGVVDQQLRLIDDTDRRLAISGLDDLPTLREKTAEAMLTIMLDVLLSRFGPSPQNIAVDKFKNTRLTLRGAADHADAIPQYFLRKLLLARETGALRRDYRNWKGIVGLILYSVDVRVQQWLPRTSEAGSLDEFMGMVTSCYEGAYLAARHLCSRGEIEKKRKEGGGLLLSDSFPGSGPG